MHCEWLTEEEILARAPNGKSKLSRFFNNRAEIEAENFANHGGEYFDPSYTQIDRIIEESFTAIPQGHSPSAAALAGAPPGMIRSYLVKWSQLPYSQSTWEVYDDIAHDENKIALYKRFNHYIPLPVCFTIAFCWTLFLFFLSCL